MRARIGAATNAYLCLLGRARIDSASYNCLCLTHLYSQKGVWRLCTLPAVSHLSPQQHSHGHHLASHLAIRVLISNIFLISPTQTAQNCIYGENSHVTQESTSKLVLICACTSCPHCECHSSKKCLFKHMQYQDPFENHILCTCLFPLILHTYLCYLFVSV